MTYALGFDLRNCKTTVVVLEHIVCNIIALTDVA